MNLLTAIKIRSNKFWRQVDKQHINDCWFWQGTMNKNGYGDFDFLLHGTRFRTSSHRASYMLANNCHIPKGLCVMHSCDNKQCVNPNHLSTGTQSDNVHDMIRKNRHPRPNGENSATAKLTVRDVIAIRQRAQNGEKLCDIANDFPVNSCQISRIVAKKRWSRL